MTPHAEHPRLVFRRKNLKAWEEVLTKIFPKQVPTTTTWKDRNQIVDVLKLLSSQKNLNHTFFPTGGGMDLTGAALSIEKDCIELHFGDYADVLKPSSMSFESFEADLEWAYFRIDALPLAASGVYQQLSEPREELLEISPGQYKNRSIFDQGFLGYDESNNEIPIPKSARLITRFLKGSFVVFAKGSIYNANTATYDARHSRMSSSEFRNHIQAVSEHLNRKK